MLPGTYQAGFKAKLLLKDLSLYAEAVERCRAATPVSPTIVGLWEAFVEAHPGDEDMTRIYPYVRDELID